MLCFVLDSNVDGVSWLAFPAILTLGCTTAAHADDTNIIHTNKIAESSLGIEFFLQINPKAE